MRAAVTVFLAGAWWGSAHGSDGGGLTMQDFADPAWAKAPSAPIRSFLSQTLGSNMVLQRAPQQAVVWGFAAAGTEVTTQFDARKPMSTKADADGVWRQVLPATEASGEPHTLNFKASTGESAQMDNVLFGDVYLCGGQSNMQFAMPAIENAAAEAKRADAYPLIRLFTVGQKTSSTTPLDDLQTIEQRWSVANHTSIGGKGGFGYFSAVCWIFGRTVFDELGGKVPLGLVSNNWGGTPVESWTTQEALTKCNITPSASPHDHAVLYNAMIYPYTVGPMALSGFTWYQGEANVDERKGDEGAARYTCTFPGMITAWRSAFKNPKLYFGFVQLSTWCGNGELIAEMRTVGQMAALSLPYVGYSTNADHGAGCNIHPPPKQFCAKRLAESAMAIQYGRPVVWKSPSFKSQVAAASPPSMTVTLNDVPAGGLRADQYPFNYMDGKFKCQADQCAWAFLQFAGFPAALCGEPDNCGVHVMSGEPGTFWVNATIAVANGGNDLVLTPQHAITAAPVGSSYGWGAVPMMNVYAKNFDLPVLPWREHVTSSSTIVV